MPRKKPFDYKAAAAALRSYGFKPKFGSKKKGCSAPTYKTTVKQQFEKIRLFVPGGSKNEFVFVETDTPEKVKASEGLNPKVRTPTGFFIQKPKGAKKFKITFEGENVVINATGQRGGKRKEKIYRLNPKGLAKNPQAEIERVTGKKVGKFLEGRLVVNGNDSHNFEHGQLAEFEKYVAEFFLQSQDPNRDGVLKGRFHGKAISARTFTDIFHVKLITQTDSPNDKTRKKKKVRRR